MSIEGKRIALVNNTSREQKTIFYDAQGKESEVVLAPMQILWK